MGISDIIAAHIQKALQNAGGSPVELQRISLAEQFRCAPSQINYVIATRFSPEHGYIVESRRGGGGYIRITRVRLDRQSLVMHAVNAIGVHIDARSAAAFLSNLGGVLEPPHKALIAAAVSDAALRAAPLPIRDAIRASILKQCLLQTLND